MKDTIDEFDVSRVLNNYLEKKFEKLLANAKELEAGNKIDESIKAYKEALELLDLNIESIDAIKLLIKIGELNDLKGLIDEGLEYYKKAQLLASNLKEQILLIDVLVKIADSYLSRGELEKSFQYLSEADKLLGCTDYIKGKIQVNIQLARLYFVKKDFFKSRDICNDTLKLCGDEFLFYKGRVLITLSELYKDIITVEEQLEILKEAYECFEKESYTRGMLGAINNIATLYSDKLQDHKKAFKYFYKLKDLVENSMYIEFRKIAYLNLGEAYLKCFDYENSLYWLNEALKFPTGTYMDNILVYNYSYVSLVALLLCDYKHSYANFINASEEVEKRFCVESTLVQYYKCAAIMFSELGKHEIALDFIKKCIELVEKDENLIKWSIGLTYEKIKLREIKSGARIVDALEGAKYTLTKYQNKTDILNEIYDIAIQLIDCNSFELADNLIQEYSNINSDIELIKLKKLYISIALSKHNNNIYDFELLTTAIELSKKLKAYKLQWKLLCLKGDYYNKEKTFILTYNCYFEACSILKQIIMSVPEEYIECFVNENNLLEPFVKLIKINQLTIHLSKIGIGSDVKIGSREQLDEIFNLCKL